jgi:Collagen triple helix repeat (20 copies)
MNRRMGLLGAGGLAAVLVAGGGTALATATGPVSGGVITGCYTNAEVNGSHAFVLQDSGTACPKGTSAVSWNEQGAAGPAGAAGPQGPAGPAGPAGATGATGAQGPAGATGAIGPQGPAGAAGTPGAGATVTALSPGDPNCASGGAAISASAGDTTAYACNGATGAPGAAGATGAAGPQGPAGDPGIAIDAGWIDITGSSCQGTAYGPDAASLSYVYQSSSTATWCLIEGFAAEPVPLLVTADNTGILGAPPSPPAGGFPLGPPFANAMYIVVQETPDPGASWYYSWEAIVPSS